MQAPLSHTDDAVTNEKRDPFDDALTKDGFHEFGNWICLSGPAHTVTNTWEPNRDVLSLKENKVGTTVVSAYGYSVNGIGQRTGLNQSGTAFSSARSIGWGYDAMGQVILNDSSIAGFDWAYLYDSIGNRTKASNVLPPPRRSNRAPQFNSLNELTGYVTETTGGNIPLLTTSHDDDGNATAYPLPAASAVNSALVWDAENRLVSTTTNNIYDSQSRRIAVTAGGITKVTVYDGWNPIADYVSGSLVRSYQWGQDLSGTLQGAGGVGGLLALSTGSQTYDPTYDGNGNVSEYLDGSGTVAAHFEYTPFGQTTVDTDSSGMFDIRFSTKRRDVETGLYYYGYRYYDPVTGRWPSRDPIKELGGINIYSYCNNKAPNFYDTNGMIPMPGVADAFENVGNSIIQSHWDRNSQNSTVPNNPSNQLPDSQSIYHQQGTCNGKTNKDNTKHVSEDGHSETVYDSDGNIVSDPVNGGTYNVSGPNEGTGLAHFLLDVVPYWLFGNSADDPTNIGERMTGGFKGDTGKFYPNKKGEDDEKSGSNDKAGKDDCSCSKK